MRILYLDLDTLRPDHLGCYGYRRNTSPHIDKIAEQGTVFTNYYCSDAPCLPSRTALFSGRFGIRTGVVNHGGLAADFRPEGKNRQFVSDYTEACLPYIFRRAGIRPVSISPFAERHSAWAFNAGFLELYNTGKRGAESAEDVTPTVLKWIENNAAEDNWFLHVNYWDAHTPYRTPADYPNHFESDPIQEWLTEEVLEKHRNAIGPHTVHEVNMYNNNPDPRYPKNPAEISNMADMKKMIDGYDNGIRYMDDHIGKIVQALKEQGVWEDMCVIISSDHGESMGELATYGEHGFADHSVCRIPMIIKWQGCKKGATNTGLHYHLDLLPTLAELFGQAGREYWDGESFAKALTVGQACSRDYLVVSQCAHVCQRGVRFEDYMYIRTYHDGYHLFPEEMLFNLKMDPHEQNNIAEEFPEICCQATHMLCEWHDWCMARSEYDTDPLWTVMHEGGPFHAKGNLELYARHLEKTGREWAIEELLRRHPKEQWK